MRCKDIIKYLEQWAPKGAAWEKDNVGLQIGNPEGRIKNIMLSLDLSEKVINQSIEKKCNLIITHHPIFYHPLKKLNFFADRISKQIEKIVKHNINLYSAHTNLDFTKDGVSFQLAKKLQLEDIKLFKPLSNNQVKLVVFVPSSHLDKVSAAMHKAGGGVINEYSHCSFRSEGTGTFKGTDKTNPTLGNAGKLEFVREMKLEMIVDKWKLGPVTDAMEKAHPYEEVAYDILSLHNKNVNYGMGAVGRLKNSMTSKEFLKLVSTKLHVKYLRYTPGRKNRIKTVTVCGGSCVDLLDEAINKNSDAFITADLKYHNFHNAEGKILLVDAGHYETEAPILDEIQNRLKSFLNKEDIKVLKFKGSTNPIIFYNKLGAN
ncbi:MAG: Nif3-like dinuclear metal center hexameric protein [Ignavibacteria bacterium]|nr:Nif3-like dinuclear metal center hexameric protein [Ignavibacteria bacterium]MBT8382409.1 Nif3-like dinuclear metal center hexameric protein [Ignavibacteria bacterium]MBT8390780.1 Nif3-like dinuclear metal center hexameric protein [Ignavibacteria bacterium]NNJ51995.1 Nif3-like dinuclear metal center hexameric protein [Ignavibacteriaceae bacterium]NNL20152.1 Nif3-like dinuclear metal center hexameric protein [Ignavibacteriaceae bacterium]